jgi:putative NADH-flavin reductase
VAEAGGYHVVLGATGGAGRALVAELARKGHRVRAVSRRATDPWPNGVESVTADILRADEVRKACRDEAIVYHAANVPYAPLSIPCLRSQSLLLATEPRSSICGRSNAAMLSRTKGARARSVSD